MRDALVGLLCGLIFGTGLLVSGMMQPSKVLGFPRPVRGVGSEPCRGDGRRPRSRLARVCLCAPPRLGREELVADGERHRPPAGHWVGLVRYRLGAGWIVSRSRRRESGDRLRFGICVRAGHDRGNAAAARVAPAQQRNAISTSDRCGRVIAVELLQSSTTLALIVTIKSHIVAWARRGPPPHPIPLCAPLKPRRGPPPGGV